MYMQNLTEKIDELFAQNKGQEAQQLLEICLKDALEQERMDEAIPIINELIGYCRETSQVEKSYEYADMVLMIMDEMQLQGSIPYATTLLNIANAYRAGGRLEDSLRIYEQVEEIYRQKLQPEDMLVASLYNNMSLLHQEMERFDLAKAALIKALEIVSKKEGAFFEVAVTYANLASTCLSLGQEEEAKEYFTKSISLFEENGILDTHYCAALSALATFHYRKCNYKDAEKYFLKAMQGIESHLGRNEYYYRMKENAEVCRQAYKETSVKGLEICRAYYEEYGIPMLEKNFSEYLDKIAVGLVGEGSDCFGFDDEFSKDHDWGPGFCMWVTKETYEQIGPALQEAYEALPKEYRGYVWKESTWGSARRGVQTISGFYRRILGADVTSDKWEKLEDYALAAATNGEVFADPEGIFSHMRQHLKENYPKKLRFLKIAEAIALFCQNGQYNASRMLKRGDAVTARLLLGKAVTEALKILYYVEEEYPPHDKWLLYGIRSTGKYENIISQLEKAVTDSVEEGIVSLQTVARMLAQILYRKDYISDTEDYLDVHVGELLFKAGIVDLTKEQLAEDIAKLEFEAFDKVKNLGGRADCQDDWFTFSVMRMSQYLTWDHTMLMQYYYDFKREYEKGHNLIEEKYGRMMKSTAPAEYEQIKDHFPVLGVQKEAIIESIVDMQVKWMETFSEEYPHLAGNARSIHSYEDNPWNTSYETYLRGEISTYSDKMLQLYGQHIVKTAKEERNPAKEIMEYSVKMYGYEDLKDAETALG